MELFQGLRSVETAPVHRHKREEVARQVWHGTVLGPEQ